MEKMYGKFISGTRAVQKGGGHCCALYSLILENFKKELQANITHTMNTIYNSTIMC